MSEWFNDEQVDHMKSLGSIPRELRCASGWHVTATEKCDCVRSPEGPAPSEPAPESVWLWRVSRDYDPASSMGRQRWSEDADAYPPEYLVGEYVRGRAAVGETAPATYAGHDARFWHDIYYVLRDATMEQAQRAVVGECPAEDGARAALSRIAKMWCQHDSEMRDICAACIAQDALGIGKPLLDALGRVPPGRDTPTGGDT